MKKLTSLTIAMLIALGLFAQSASAVEDPHSSHAVPPSPTSPSAGGQSGEMHEMMMQHMLAMRGHARPEDHKAYAEIVLQYANDIKLNDEQIGKITRIHQAAQKQMEELGPKLHDSLKATHEVFLNPASDEAAIRKVAKEHTKVFEELVESGLKSRNEINAVLTPEQLKQLQTKKAPH